MVTMLRSSIILALLILSSSIVAAQSDCLYYFYGGLGCDSCDKVNAFLDQLEHRYPELKVEKYDVYYERDKLPVLEQYFAAYKVPNEARGLPVVFLPGSYFIGADSITSLLEERIKDNKNSHCPSVDDKDVVGITGRHEPIDVFKTFTFSRISGTALKDSVRPAGIALLLVLLASLMAIPDKRQSLAKGLTFALGASLAFLLYGMGLFSWFGFPELSYILSKLIAVLALLLGLTVIVLFFRSPKRAEKPMKSSPWLTASLSYGGLLGGGFIVGLCTTGSLHQSFLLLRHLFADHAVRWFAFFLLLYYVFLLIILTLIIAVGAMVLRAKLEDHAFHKGTSDYEKKRWQKHNHRVLQVAIAGLICLLSIAALLA